jgi:hypothetical protein
MRAIIVGTSAELLENKNGVIIDSFDYVARSISVAEFPGYEEHVGTKTDMFWSKYQYLFRFKFLNFEYNKDLLLLEGDPDNYSENFCHNHTYEKYIRIFFDYWYEIVCRKHRLRHIFHYNRHKLHTLHRTMCYKNCNNSDGPAVYSSAGARVLDFFTSRDIFDEVWVTGFSFFDKATYFNPAINHMIKEHCYYKEKYYYRKLLKDKKIYEL